MRVKTFFVMAVALLWPVLVFSETPEIRVTSFVSGNDLFHVCADGRDAVRQICDAYVEGVTDTIVGVNALEANGLAIPSACLPKGIAPEQVRAVVVQYLIANPAIRHLAAAGHALSALQAAFPCK
jgi:hypothetical protein